MSFAIVLDRKRAAATAGRAGLNVLDQEARSLKTVLIVDFGAGQVLHADGVDQYGDTVLVDSKIVFANRFVEREIVLETGAATTADGDAQLQFGVAVFGDQLRGFGNGRVGKFKSCGGFGHGSSFLSSGG